MLAGILLMGSYCFANTGSGGCHFGNHSRICAPWPPSSPVSEQWVGVRLSSHTQPTPTAPFHFSADIHIYLLFYLLLFSLFQNEHSMRAGALLLFLDISLKPRLKPGRYQEFSKHLWKESIVWPDTFLLSSAGGSSSAG